MPVTAIFVLGEVGVVYVARRKNPIDHLVRLMFARAPCTAVGPLLRCVGVHKAGGWNDRGREGFVKSAD